MFTIATITLEGIRNFIIACAFIALFAGLLLFAVGCNSPLRAPRSPPSIARPAIVIEETASLFTWQFLARNGVMVHKSPMAYREIGDLIAHYAHVRRLMVQASSPTTIQQYKGDAGKFRWALFDETTGERVEISDQPFASANACRDNYDDLRAAVLDCPPDDLDRSLLP